MTTFLGEIAGGVRCALEPLQNAFANEDTLACFLGELGWDVVISPSAMATIRAGFAIEAVFEEAMNIATQLDSRPDDAALAASLLQAIAPLVQALAGLAATPPAGLPAPFDSPTFWAEVPGALADHLLLRLIEKQTRPLYAMLRLLGIAEITDEAPAGEGRKPYRRMAIHWERLPRVIGDPAGLLRELYRWQGSPQPFDHARATGVLTDAFRALGFPARLDPPTTALATRYYTAANPALTGMREVAIPFATSATPDWSIHAEIGLIVLPVPPAGNPGAPPAGIVITPLGSGGAVAGGAPADTVFVLDVHGGMDLTGALGVEVLPGGVTFFAAPGAASIDAGVAISGRPPQPWVLLGEAGATRFEVGGFVAGIDLQGRLDSPGVKLRLGTGTGPSPPKLGLVIQMNEADGFLGKVLGANPIRLEFGGQVIWDSRSGKIYFEGAGGFEMVLPLHLNFGIGELETLALALTAQGGGIGLDAGVTIRADLGPLKAVAENFGLRLRLNFADPAGKLGNLGVSLGFKPPNGIGLSIDASVVKGGGYLYIDTEHGRYAGVLELALADIVTITAIGLIDTKMPDGSTGFSLLILMSVEFGTGIQLGFGFSLLAVGGLLGLNRTMNLQALADGVRSGAINSVMFPHDVVANASKIISDLRTFFPPREGNFLIGPMVKIGWGTPTLVSVAMGIIIEIPGNIAILGVLRVALPTADAPLINLQVSFIGAIEFDKDRLWFFASLYDSRIVFLTIDGEMGLLVAWGDDANFVVSVGGFHPRFAPPPLPFPSPRRICVSLLSTPVSRIRIEGYFAVTTNTVQFGARAELFFGLDEINVQGGIAFDALFQFSPFYFVIEISASLSVKVFGVGLFSVSIHGTLEGPTPYHVVGHGSISLLFWDVGVDFETSWGEDRREVLPPVALLPLLTAELGKLANWTALLPAGNNLLVAIRKPSEDELILHPVGVLRVSQRALPLALTLDKMGSQKPSDVKRLMLTVSAVGLVKTADTLEKFAPAQFQNFSDAEKLSKPAFAPQVGGLELAPSGDEMRSAVMVKRVLRYEESIIDNNFLRFRHRFQGLIASLFELFAGSASITLSELSVARKRALEPFDDRMTVVDETFVVARQADNGAFASDSVAFRSESSAREYLRAQVANDASLADEIHVIPSFEMAA